MRPAQAIARSLRRTDESFTLPMLDEVEVTMRDSSRGLSRLQNGLVRTYAFATVLGMVALVVAFLWIEA